MKTFYSEEHRKHEGTAELNDGKMVPVFEKPQRAEFVLARVKETSLGAIEAPRDFGRAPLARVHSADYLDFLERAHELWRAEHGDWDALPLNWVGRGMRHKRPETIDGLLSYYSFDAGTPITAGTWPAITASANCALSAAREISDGASAAFALCRPPGHHAAADYLGGYCYLNNAAIAAQWLRDQGTARVAILDADYHHGNGTQSIFYARGDVYFASLHGHPAQEYPFFLGYEDETGEGGGAGCNANYPLRWGSDFARWGAALDRALAGIAAFEPDALVVSLGVDTFEKDPISRFKLKSEDYLTVGRRIASLKRPTAFVMEGGYAVAEIGINAVNVLQGFEGA
ncbi:MAG: histone deacetylase family protein [Kiloniellales bacterium]